MSEPLDTEPPRNATDRNTQTAVGIWHGHITLPSSFLTLLLIVPTIAFLIVIHWCFDEVATIRGRLMASERIIYNFIESGAVVAPGASPAPKPKP